MKYGHVIPNAKRIGILRANALGDFIFALPALNSVKATYPNSQIVYLGTPWHKEFLSSRPSPVDKVIVVPFAKGVREKKNGKFSNKQIENFFRKMAGFEFDIVIQMHGGGKNSNPFIKRFNHNLSVGSRTKDADELDLSIPYDVYQNEYARYLEIVSLIGCKNYNFDPVLSVTSKDIEDAKPFIPSNAPYIVLHVGASDLRRRLSWKKFAKVADGISQRGYKVVFTGQKKESRIIKKILSSMRTEAVDLSGKLTLSGLIGILSMSELVISNDTGPLHLADAIGKKTVGIYWCGNGVISAPLSRTNHRVLMSWVVNCPLCKTECVSSRPFERSKKDCQHETSFVDNITSSEVLAASYELLARDKSFQNPQYA